MDQRWARPWFAATAACVVAGIVIQMFVNGHNASFFGGSTVGRILNIFAFFTIDSNVLIGVACALLAIRLDRTSTPFAVLRLTGLISITVTFVVFHVVLSRLLDLDSWAQAANQLQHTVVPILSIVGWLAFGPRGLTSGPMIKLTVIFPLAYMLFTAIRGPLASNWYPYPFVNVHELGYVRVLINAVWIALLFIGFAAAATALDRRLAGPPATGHPAP
jgi:hypothetical protein